MKSQYVQVASSETLKSVDVYGKVSKIRCTSGKQLRVRSTEKTTVEIHKVK